MSVWIRYGVETSTMAERPVDYQCNCTSLQSKSNSIYISIVDLTWPCNTVTSRFDFFDSYTQRIPIVSCNLEWDTLKLQSCCCNNVLAVEDGNNARRGQNWGELASFAVELGLVWRAPVSCGPRTFASDGQVWRKDAEENTTEKARIGICRCWRDTFNFIFAFAGENVIFVSMVLAWPNHSARDGTPTPVICVRVDRRRTVPRNARPCWSSWSRQWPPPSFPWLILRPACRDR